MALGYEIISQPPSISYEMISQPPIPLCENFRSCETPLWHTSAISHTPPPPHFAAAKSLRNPPHLKIPKFAAEPHFVGGFTAAKPPLGTRVPFHSSIPSFHSCEICPPPLRYENSHLLRK